MQLVDSTSGCNQLNGSWTLNQLNQLVEQGPVQLVERGPSTRWAKTVQLVEKTSNPTELGSVLTWKGLRGVRVDPLVRGSARTRNLETNIFFFFWFQAIGKVSYE